MDLNIVDGLLNCLTLANLFYSLVGCLLGTVVGVLPGLGPASTLAILLPLTSFINPTGALIMMSGLYYGAAYGGSTTSILLNMPGEASSVATCLDGFQMTRQGRAGQALWMAAVGSFIAGTAGALVISFVAPLLAKFAILFSPAEYFGLILFSLTSLVSLSTGSLLKSFAAVLLGMFLTCVGVDELTGTARLNFGSHQMMRGFDLVGICVGLFGIGEVLQSLEQGVVQIYEGKLGKMMPRGEDLKNGLKAAFRGTGIGYVLGLLPGIVAPVTTFISYDVEKRMTRHPEKFGKGAIEGVAGPEAANNATVMAGFVPLMALGIPTSPAFSIMLAALMMYGLTPGPQLFDKTPLFAWTVIGSMYIGNAILLILNLPLVSLWARISKVPYKLLAPIILAVCIVGAYSPRNAMFDVWVALGFGLLGYVMRKVNWPIAPLILGYILGAMLESALRNSMQISFGSLAIFVERPISATFLALTVIWMAVVPWIVRRRIQLAKMEEETL
jgi:putative tricarboxylic transport membrane protein